jgi:pentatricopeptide repeat protein
MRLGWVWMLCMAALLEEMGAVGVVAHVGTCNTVMSACLRAGQGQVVLDVLRGMKEQGINPSLPSYTIAMEAAVRARVPREACLLWEELQQRGHQPDSHATSVALRAWGDTGDWQGAVERLETVANPTVFMLNAVLHALVKAGQAHEAFRVAAAMQAKVRA